MSTTALLDPTHYSFPWHGHPVQNAEIFLYPSQWVNDKNVMKCDKNFKSWGEGFREGQWHQDLSIYWTQLSIDLDDMTTSNELLRSKKSGGQYHQDRKRVVRFPNPLAPEIQIHVSWGTRLMASVQNGGGKCLPGKWPTLEKPTTDFRIRVYHTTGFILLCNNLLIWL